MLKLTQKTVFALLAVSVGCQNQPDREQYQQQFRRQVDSLAEARIDSAYKAIQQHCDSLLMHQVPLWADSLAKAIQDSADKKKRI